MGLSQNNANLMVTNNAEYQNITFTLIEIISNNLREADKNYRLAKTNVSYGRAFLENMLLISSYIDPKLTEDERNNLEKHVIDVRNYLKKIEQNPIKTQQRITEDEGDYLLALMRYILTLCYKHDISWTTPKIIANKQDTVNRILKNGR